MKSQTLIEFYKLQLTGSAVSPDEERVLTQLIHKEESSTHPEFGNMYQESHWTKRLFSAISEYAPDLRPELTFNAANGGSFGWKILRKWSTVEMTADHTPPQCARHNNQ